MARHGIPCFCLAALALAFLCLSLPAPARAESQSIRASNDDEHEIFTVHTNNRNHACGNFVTTPLQYQLLCESGCSLGVVGQVTCSRENSRSPWECEAYGTSDVKVTSLRAFCCSDVWGGTILDRCFVRYRLEPTQPSTEVAPVVAGKGIPVSDRSSDASQCDDIRKLLNAANDQLEEEVRLCRRDLHRAEETIQTQVKEGIKPVSDVLGVLIVILVVGIGLLGILGLGMAAYADRMKEIIDVAERQVTRMRTLNDAAQRLARGAPAVPDAAKPKKQPPSSPA